MLIAWPLLSFTAIFFAACMKPALPNGQWFQVYLKAGIIRVYTVWEQYVYSLKVYSMGTVCIYSHTICRAFKLHTKHLYHWHNML